MLQLLKDLWIESKTDELGHAKEECIFVMFLLPMLNVLYTFSEYLYFYVSRNITSATFLLVFKIVESIKCIFNKIMIFFNVIWAIKKHKLKILFHNNYRNQLHLKTLHHSFFYTKNTVTNENTSLLTFQYTCSYMYSFLRLIRWYITFSISNSGPFLGVYTVCDNSTQSPALFQNIFKFSTFLPKFSKILPFFWRIVCMPTMY